MNDARIRVELSIKRNDDDDDQDAIDQFCNHLRSGRSSCKNFEVSSLSISDEMIDLQLDEIQLTVWVDIRSSDNAEGARKQVADHIMVYFMGDPSVSLGSMPLQTELIPRRREAIEATKAKQARRRA